MRTFLSWLSWKRSQRAARRLAEKAFRSAYPAVLPQSVETIAEDERAYVIQVLHGSAACRMASFWEIAKSDLAAHEIHASEIRHFLNDAGHSVPEQVF